MNLVLLTLDILLGKTIAVKSSRIFKMPAALESFEKDLVKKVLINSVDGLENGQCMILDVTEKRDDAYVCSSVSVNEEKTRYVVELLLFELFFLCNLI